MRFPPVVHVSCRRNHSQIAETIVGLDSVDMVYLVVRPFAGNVKPCKAMRLELLADYPNSPISVFGLRSGLSARRDMLARLVNPSELTCFWGIAKDGFQVRLSKHFGVL